MVATKALTFELGKFYQHTSGNTIPMHMIAIAKSLIMWKGPILIAEDTDGHLRPCGMDSTNAKNWTEISREDYENFFDTTTLNSREDYETIL